MGFQTNIFCHAPSPTSLGTSENFFELKNEISTLYILHESVLKRQEMPFQRPKFQNICGGGGGMPPDPLQLCRHYGLPLTKILATPLHAVLTAYL